MKTLDSSQKDFLIRLLECHMEGLSGWWSEKSGWDSPEVEDEYEEAKSIRDQLKEKTMSKINYIHQRVKVNNAIHNRGGTTIAFRELEDGTIEYAMAHCSVNDNFSKEVGRVKASGRLNSEKYRNISNLSWLEFIKKNAVNFIIIDPIF